MPQGPHRIQVWRWLDQDRFGRVYAGEGPAWSEALQAWVHATKGGSWFDGPEDCRAAARRRRLENELDLNLGFRVVREI